MVKLSLEKRRTDVKGLAFLELKGLNVNCYSSSGILYDFVLPLGNSAHQIPQARRLLGISLYTPFMILSFACHVLSRGSILTSFRSASIILQGTMYAPQATAEIG